MANKYTQAFSTEYIPQYQPPNIYNYVRAANVLQDRQQQGMQQYDALRQSVAQLDVLNSDQPKLQEKVEEINSRLSQFEDSNDFIDAMPAIRREARNLTKEMQEGWLGDALQSKQNAMQTFEAIDKSDWSPEAKERMKTQYLNRYEGAGSGRLPVWTPPESIDIEDEAMQVAKSVESTSRDVLGVVQGPDGASMRAKITQEGRDANQIQSSIQNLYRDDTKFRRALQQEAINQGYTTEEELNDYVSRRLNALTASAATRFGPQSSSMSNVQWNDSEGTTRFGPNSSARVVAAEGIVEARNVVSDVNRHLNDMFNAQTLDEQDKYQTLNSGLNMVLGSAVKEGAITPEEQEYFQENMMEQTGEGRWSLSKAFSSSSWGGMFGGSDSKEGNRFQKIKQKLNTFIEEEGDIVGTSFEIPAGSTKRGDINDFMSDRNPANFTLISSEDAEGLSEKEKRQKIKKILREGNMEAVHLSGNSSSPFFRFSWEDEDGNYHTSFLGEKRSDRISGSGFRSPFEEVVRTFMEDDATANRIVDNYMLHDVPETGKNVYDMLPPSYKATMSRGDHLSLQAQEGGGVIAKLDEQFGGTITKTDIFGTSWYNMLQSGASDVTKTRDYRIIEDMVENSNSLLESQKNLILEKIGEGRLEDLPQDLKNTLKSEFNTPYEFGDKIEAIEFATERSTNTRR